MNKLQNINWNCLPKETREEIRAEYKKCIKAVEATPRNYIGDTKQKYIRDNLEYYYGHHNLTSDTEPEELLHISRQSVIDKYAEIFWNKAAYLDSSPEAMQCQACLNVLKSLFGDKCLPDKPINGAIGTTPPAYKLDVRHDNPNTPNSGELKSQEADNKPRFNKGDSVLHIPTHLVYDVVEYRADLKSYKLSRMSGVATCFANEIELEPYVEPDKEAIKDFVDGLIAMTRDELGIKVEPKFSKGDKVKVVNDAMHNGKIGEVIGVDGSMIAVELDDGTCVVWHERYFEPYTEPETKDAYEQYKEAEAEKYKNQLEDMEEKELNLIEILKNCQKGERFFSLIAGDVTFQGVDSHWEQAGWKPIRCTGGDYNSDGTYTDPSDKGICCLYPSRSLYEKYPLAPVKAWEVWAGERKPKHVLQAEIRLISNDGKTIEGYENVEVEVSDVDLTQAAEAVKECLEKFHKDHTQS